MAVHNHFVQRVGQPSIGANRLRIARPGRAEDSDVVFAVAIPIAHDRLIVASAEFCPQIGGVQAAVAVEVDEPLAVDEESDFLLAIAAEIAGEGDAVFQSATRRCTSCPVASSTIQSPSTVFWSVHATISTGIPAESMATCPLRAPRGKPASTMLKCQV